MRAGWRPSTLYAYGPGRVHVEGVAHEPAALARGHFRPDLGPWNVAAPTDQAAVRARRLPGGQGACAAHARVGVGASTWSARRALADLPSNASRATLQMHSGVAQTAARTASAMESGASSETWSDLAALMVSACEETVGRERETIGLPYHAREAARRHTEIERRVQAVKDARLPADVVARRGDLKRARRSFRRDRRRWKAAWVACVCDELDAAIQWHDMGRFYGGLRRLGVDLATYTSRGKEEFTCEQIRSHIGATPNEVGVTQLGLPEARPQ